MKPIAVHPALLLIVVAVVALFFAAALAPAKAQDLTPDEQLVQQLVELEWNVKAAKGILAGSKRGSFLSLYRPAVLDAPGVVVGAAAAYDVQLMYETLDLLGFDVVTVQPLIQAESRFVRSDEIGGSRTQGYIVVGKRR